jgi:WD40 repeat protein
MIFELVQDFKDVVEAMPREHQKHRMLELLDEAIRRDIHFINRHPTTLFQCMWNSCWWYDCPDAEQHYSEPCDHRREQRPWLGTGAKLYSLMQVWRNSRLPCPWLRSLLPRTYPPLGAGMYATIGPLSNHEDNFCCVTWTPDGRKVVAGHECGGISVWGVSDCRQLLFLQRHTWPVECVAVSSDGSAVISAPWDGSVTTSDLLTGDVLGVLPPEQHRRTLAPHPTEPFVAIHCVDTISLYSVPDLKKIRVLHIGFQAMARMRFTPDGTILLCASTDGTFVGIRVIDGVVLHEHVAADTQRGPGHDQIDLWAFSPDGTLVAYIGDKGRILYTATSELVADFEPGPSMAYLSLDFDPSGRKLVLAVEEGTLRLFDVHSGTCICYVPTDQDIMWEARYSPDGRMLVSCGAGRLILWVSDRLCTPLTREHSPLCRDTEMWSPDGRYLYATCWIEGTLGCQEFPEKREVATCKAVLRFPHYSRKGWHYDAALSADGSRLAVWFPQKSCDEENSEVVVWDAASARELLRLSGVTKAELCVLSVTGTFLLVGDKTELCLWSVDGQKELARVAIRSSDCRLERIFVLPDGSRFGWVNSHEVTVWHTDQGTRTVTVLSRGGRGSHGVAVSTQSMILAVSDVGLGVVYTEGRVVRRLESNRVLIWDLKNDCELSLLSGDGQRANAVFLSRDGMHLITIRDDRQMCVFSLPSGVCEMTGFVRLDEVDLVVVSNDGQRLLAADDQGVEVWDIARRTLAWRSSDAVISRSVRFQPEDAATWGLGRWVALSSRGHNETVVVRGRDGCQCAWIPMVTLSLAHPLEPIWLGTDQLMPEAYLMCLEDSNQVG